ncbi:hypothetical protein NL676_016823 [Syzygium grande]|nr:hypothetical protein NL676_016823 [Syzygium grande]
MAGSRDTILGIRGPSVASSPGANDAMPLSPPSWSFGHYPLTARRVALRIPPLLLPPACRLPIALYSRHVLPRSMLSVSAKPAKFY